jgi:hypothetical protein
MTLTRLAALRLGTLSRIAGEGLGLALAYEPLSRTTGERGTRREAMGG